MECEGWLSILVGRELCGGTRAGDRSKAAGGSVVAPPVPGSLTVAISRGGCPSIDAADSHRAILGHTLRGARRRYLRDAEWIVAMDDARPVGLAAYQPVDSDVRLVLEFLRHTTLEKSRALHATALLLATVEQRARQDGIQWLMFALDAEVPLRPFKRGGYQAMAIDSAGVWVQKRIGVPEEPPRVRRHIH